MSNPDLPGYLLEALAHPQFRSYHNLWHLVRSRPFWVQLLARDPDLERRLRDEGWYPDHFAREEGAGVDFLGMHRGMIRMVNMIVAGDESYPRVEPWEDIPSTPDDPEYPVPEWNATAADFPSFPPPAAASQAASVNYTKSDDSVTDNLKLVRDRFRNPEWLRTKTLDEIGTDVEWSIHGWLHYRWSDRPPADPGSSDVSNDWLFQSWSSHVNKVFWKLHGWIDDCIGAWESANEEEADFSNAWVGVVPSVPPVLPERVEMLTRHMLSTPLHEELEKFPHVVVPMEMDPEIMSELLSDQ